MSTRRNLLEYWTQRFLAAHVDSPRLSAEVLLAHVLRLERLSLLLELDVVVSDVALQEFCALASRRELGEPVAYLIGSREFYGFDFRVTPDVLIPRPETELMVDYIHTLFDQNDSFLAYDVGTGSGAIAIAVARCFPKAHLVASDISLPALRLAKQNAIRLGVSSRVFFVQADLTLGLLTAEANVVFANLPYVPKWRMATMSAEVLGFEPHGALFAGFDGLACYRRLASAIVEQHMPGSVLLCEMDRVHGEVLRGLFSQSATKVEIHKDYSGHDRMLSVVF